MPELTRDATTSYHGWRSSDGPRVVRTDVDGTNTGLAPNPKSGLPGNAFDWGIDSPEAGQLAFAVLADAFGEEEASALHVDFKFDVIADLDDEWVLLGKDLADWLENYADD